MGFNFKLFVCVCISCFVTFAILYLLPLILNSPDNSNYYIDNNEIVKTTVPLRNQKNKPRKITIYLHIGPHYTGCTRIQNTLYSLREQLAQKGYCLPSYTENSSQFTEFAPKAINALPLDLIVKNELNERMINEIGNCMMTNNHSIIISTEELSNLNITQIIFLKETLTTLFTTISITGTVPTVDRLQNVVTNKNKKKLKSNTSIIIEFQVILVFRELLSRVYSFFVELMEKNDCKTNSFPKFLFQYFDEIENLPKMNIFDVTKKYSDVFGIKSLTIIDYDGVQSAKKDITYVFLCHILKTLCSSTVESLNSNIVIENKSQHMKYFHFIHLFAYYLQIKGYKFCLFPGDLITELIDENYYTLNIPTIITLPSITSNLHLFHQYSKGLDQTFRKHFGQRILYTNVTATYNIIEHFTAEELDELRILQDSQWIQFFYQELNHLRKVEKICYLNGTILPPAIVQEELGPAPAAITNPTNINGIDSENHASSKNAGKYLIPEAHVAEVDGFNVDQFLNDTSDSQLTADAEALLDKR